MPIDPNIALRYRAPEVQVAGPLETMGRVLSLKNLQQQGQMGQLQLQQAQQAQADDAASRKVFASYDQQNPEASLSELWKVSPTKAAAFQRQLSEQKKADLEAKIKQTELYGKQSERLGSIAGSITDEQSYHRGIGAAISEGLIPAQAGAQMLSQPWNEQTAGMVKTFAQQAMSAKEQHAATLAEAQAQLAKEAASRAAAEHDAKMPGIVADSKLKQATAAGQAPIQPYQKAQLEKENNPTEAGLAAKAAAGDPVAEAALRRLDKSRRESRPVVNVSAGAGGAAPSDAKSIATAIMDGKQPPDLKGMYRFAAPVRAELARQGYDLTSAQRDWSAVQKHIATLNGPQQERLRQAVSFAYDQIDVIEGLYSEWKKIAGVSGFKDINRANLALSKRLPGRVGEVATLLESQINDFTSEMGTVYKGGNSSTDEGLRLAAGNLKAEWNSNTFERGLKILRQNLGIRKNSIYSSEPVGMTPNSPYNAPKPAAQPTVGTVKMRAPNGQTADVPADQVQHYEKLGAKRI